MIKHRLQLPDLMRQLKLPMVAAEIGVAEGYNSADLLERGIEKLFMIDNWGKIETQTGDGNNEDEWHYKNMKDAYDRVEKFEGKYEVLRGLSVEMAKRVEDESLGMIYLDADHSYEGVIRDLEAWYPKVVSGGLIAGHDFLQSHYGVNQAATEFAGRVGVTIHTIPEHKTEDAGFLFIKP